MPLIGFLHVPSPVPKVSDSFGKPWTRGQNRPGRGRRAVTAHRAGRGFSHRGGARG